jgi:phosphoglycolate phosphatase
MFRYVLFDLDGTLTDPGEGITKSIRYAFEYYGYPVESLEALQVYIGPPLEEEFMVRLGVDYQRAVAITEKFRERYNTIGWKENHPIPGMPEALAALKAAGCKLAVATSKPLPIATTILEYFDLAKYFDAICGSDPDGGNGSKWIIVKRALEKLGVTEETKHLAVMVGDRKHDIIGGQKNGLTTVGLTMGYGSREEFDHAGVSFVAESGEELVTRLLAKKVLLTAFEPFGGDTENASALVCQRIPEETAHYQAVKKILPVEFKAGPEALRQAIEEVHPDLILCLGQAGGRSQVTPEKVAINLMDGRIPDNAGFSPDEEPILPEGKTAYFTNTPIKQAVAAAREAGLPVAMSYTAGAYVCNTIFYTVMAEIDKTEECHPGSRMQGDFIHVPYLTEQKDLPEQVPACPLEQVVKAVAFLVDYLARVS